MKKTFRFRLAAALMSAAITVGAAALPASATYNNSTTGQADAFSTSYQSYWKYVEKNKFPAGKYWNGGNPESYTNSPCRNHNACTRVRFDYTIGAGYTALPSNEKCSGLIQCYGFARKLATDFYGGCQVWTRQRTDKNYQVRVGDQIRIRYTSSNGRYSDHSVFVTDVTGSSFKYADCNYYGTCQIRWDNPASIHNGGFIENGNYYSILWVDRPAMAGDINGDSVVDGKDSSALYSIYRGTYNYGNANQRYVKQVADINNDGKVNYSDYTLCLQYRDGYLPYQRFITNI